MRTWSVALAIEAVACAGIHTLIAPLSLFVVLVPMASWGAVMVLAFFVASAVALVAYWQLAVATIERKIYRFGLLYWSGVAAMAAVSFLLARAEYWWFWALVLAPPMLSALHFTYLQAKASRHSVAAGSQ